MTPKARYDHEADLPPIVRRAIDLANDLRFENSCHPAYGRLLRVLAGRAARALETGAGCGVGAAWIASGLPARATLTTFEVDHVRAVAVKELFAADARVEVVEGDATKMALPAGIDLFFMDGGFAAESGLDPVVAALAIGGVVVKDDLRFGSSHESDPRKKAWFDHPQLVAVEVMVAAPDWSAIIATRTS